MAKQKTPILDIRSLLEGGFHEETARQLYAQGEEVAIFVMMQLAALALKTNEINGTHPSEPSGTVATYLKGSGKQRKKKPGAKQGHKGSRRPPPEKITRREEHRAKCCPDCGGKLRKRAETRKRYTEDILDNITPDVTEHVIHRDYCPHCKKIVEPVVSDAMPNATIGNRTVVLTAFLHDFVGATISQIVEIFNTQFYFKVTPGGLVHLWHNLASALLLWYEQIGFEAKNSAVLHADETGWRQRKDAAPRLVLPHRCRQPAHDVRWRQLVNNVAEKIKRGNDSRIIEAEGCRDATAYRCRTTR